MDVDMDLDSIINENNYTNAEMNEYMKSRYKKRRKGAIGKKGGKCSKCGSTKNLELHHKSRKGKDAAVAKMSSASDEKWNKELSKCVVLCAKCHKAETKKQFQKKKNIVKEAMEKWKYERELEEAKKGYNEFMAKRKTLLEEVIIDKNGNKLIAKRQWMSVVYQGVRELGHFDTWKRPNGTTFVLPSDPIEKIEKPQPEVSDQDSQWDL